MSELTYEIIDTNGNGKLAIKCLICDMTSHNKNDINQKYCGNCHQFHNILKYMRDSEKENADL